MNVLAALMLSYFARCFICWYCNLYKCTNYDRQKKFLLAYYDQKNIIFLASINA